jgi:hypothetical protein
MGGLLSGAFNDELHDQAEQESWSQRFWKNMPSAPQGLVDFAAGFGNVASFGGTKALRELWSSNSYVNFDSGYYTVGEIGGLLNSSAIAGMGTMARAIYNP